MEFGMSHRLKAKEKFASISVKEIWHNLDGLQKTNCGVFEFSRPKVAQDDWAS